MSEFQIQEQQYRYPYHHIPVLDESGEVSLHRCLDWGFEYMCYLLHIHSLVSNFASTSVLDVGCGDGRLLGMLDGSMRRVGVDLSERAIRFAQAFDPEGEYRVLNAADLTETFDVVVAMEVLEHIPDGGIGAFIRTLEARTRIGGTVVISVPTVVVPMNRKHFRHYDLPMLQRQIAESNSGLSIDRVEYVYR